MSESGSESYKSERERTEMITAQEATKTRFTIRKAIHWQLCVFMFGVECVCVSVCV